MLGQDRAPILPRQRRRECWFSRRRFRRLLQPRLDLPEGMEDELSGWRHWLNIAGRSRLHATHDESISRMLDVFEKVNRDIPFNGLHWFFDHAETITERNIERVKALGGGIAVSTVWLSRANILSTATVRCGQTYAAGGENARSGGSGGLGTDATRVAS